jgi:glutathione S-transferase
MRMVQMVTVNELMPKLLAVANADVQPLTEKLQSELDTGLQFLEEQLNHQNYFGGDTLNLADIVTGATIPLLYRLGIALNVKNNFVFYCLLFVVCYLLFVLRCSMEGLYMICRSITNDQ